jgi:ATP-binding cassette subfamily G (WHITE) protein 2 (SNQ2)
METPSDARTLRDSMARASGHGDIYKVNADFHALERSLSEHKTSVEKLPEDLEKGDVGPAEKPFDLRDYLSSANDAGSQAGIKHKHVGVTWEDLEVVGFGGVGTKVG